MKIGLSDCAKPGRINPASNVDFYRDAHMVMGLPLDAITKDEAVHIIQQAALTGNRCFLSTPNLNFWQRSVKDVAFRNALIDSDLVVADGVSLLWVARLLAIPLPERVAGSDFLDRFRGMGLKERPLRVYFVGGQPGVAEIACKQLAKQSPGLVGVGWDSLGYGEPDHARDAHVVEHINASKADFVLVALGAQRGQTWIQANKSSIDAPVIGHLGAVINFIAGTVTRAPIWIQKLSLEWAWRIRQEPGLFRRYWKDGLAYFWALQTHVLPLRRLTGEMKKNPAYLAPLLVTVQEYANGDALLLLSGSAHQPGLDPLRRILSNLASKAVSNITLDLSDCVFLDSSFLGLMALTLKHQRSIGGQLSLVRARPEIRRLIELFHAGYLLTELRSGARDTHGIAQVK